VKRDTLGVLIKNVVILLMIALITGFSFIMTSCSLKAADNNTSLHPDNTVVTGAVMDVTQELYYEVGS